MAKLYILFVILLIAFADPEPDDFEDFDTSFDDLFQVSEEEQEEIKREREELKVKEEQVESWPKRPVPVEEPAPKFHTATEKYFFYANKYKLEMLFGLVFVLYFINFNLGKRTNNMIAKNFHNRILENLANNFAQVRFGNQPNQHLN